MPSEADGISAGGMCFSSLHNWCDTTQYGEKNSRENEHLAYLEILSGGHEMIRLQDKIFFFLWLGSKPANQEILSQAQKYLWNWTNTVQYLSKNMLHIAVLYLLITRCLVIQSNIT